MGRSLRIAVIADDITGAADTGVQFCPVVGPVQLARADEGALAFDTVWDAGIAVFTNTRHVQPAAAADAVRKTTKSLQELNPSILYKKIDSCLRGNVGAEIDALLQATGLPASFVAPALPQQGRITVNDWHLINGVPVAQAEVGRDPRHPVRESRLSALLAAQSIWPVGHVRLDTIENGSDATVKRIRFLLDQGCRHITFDARQSGHLDTIAGLKRGAFKDVLLVGSAGLAGSLSRQMREDGCRIHPVQRPRIDKWLFVCGSASHVLAEQLAVLVRQTGWPHLAIDPSQWRASDEVSSKALLLSQLIDPSDTAGVILSLQPKSGNGPRLDPERFVRCLAGAAVDLMEKEAPDGLFLSGGDTAEAFWCAIGAHALLIREEILPGLVLGEFIGGRDHGVTVVTKAGAFGSAETLIQLVRFLK